MPTCSNWRGQCRRRWPRRSATRSWRAPRAAFTGWADCVGPHRAPRARPTPRRTPRERSSRRARGPGCAARARRRSRRARRSSGPSQSPLPDVTVVLAGGVRTPSDSLVGPVAVTALRSLHVDVLFTGVHGMASDAGFTTPNLLEAETNRALIECAERTVVIADHTKWGVRGLSRFARLDEADALITDAGLPPEARTVLGEHIERVIIAPARRRPRQSPVTSDGAAAAR